MFPYLSKKYVIGAGIVLIFASVALGSFILIRKYQTAQEKLARQQAALSTVQSTEGLNSQLQTTQLPPIVVQPEKDQTFIIVTGELLRAYQKDDNLFFDISLHDGNKKLELHANLGHPDFLVANKTITFDHITSDRVTKYENTTAQIIYDTYKSETGKNLSITIASEISPDLIPKDCTDMCASRRAMYVRYSGSNSQLKDTSKILTDVLEIGMVTNVGK